MVMWATAGEIIARLTGLEFVHLTHFVSNPHIYGDPSVPISKKHSGDQSQGVEIMLGREPAALPTVQIGDPIVDAVRLMLEGEADPLSLQQINPDKLPYSDFLKLHAPLTDYHPGKFIPRKLLPVAF